jgi:hypothetical protein
MEGEGGGERVSSRPLCQALWPLHCLIVVWVDMQPFLWVPVKRPSLLSMCFYTSVCYCKPEMK